MKQEIKVQNKTRSEKCGTKSETKIVQCSNRKQNGRHMDKGTKNQTFYL